MSITPRQFEQMQARLGGSQRRPAPVLETGLGRASGKNQIILGVDPSLRGTGYGVIQAARPSPRAMRPTARIADCGGVISAVK